MRALWLCGLVPLLAPAGALAQESGGAKKAEEMVVTGSYIKRDNFEMASPMSVIDQQDLLDQATPALGEVIANQTFNYGTETASLHYATNFQEGTEVQANFRGLGSRATLNLVDGMRVVSNSLDTLVPQIAIARIDILKDGAAALYGSDAVAGVLNAVTRKNFEGIEGRALYQADAEGDMDETEYQFILGVPTENGHVVAALEYRNRTDLKQTDRPEYLVRGFSRSGTPNPGNYLVPRRDATGAISGQGQLRDPGCGVAASPGGNGAAAIGNVRNNISGSVVSAAACGFQFGEFFDFIAPAEYITVWSNFEYQASDRVTLNQDFIYSRQESESRGSPSNPGGRTGELAPIRGEHPGNPFRAFSDLNGNGSIDLGERLFAQDANNDGIPDRNASDQVILAANPFDATSGIPFNEDVRVAQLRLFGKLGTLPSTLNADGSNTDEGEYDRYTIRSTTSMNWDIDGNWSVDAGFMFQSLYREALEKNQSFNAVVRGLEGKLATKDSATETFFYNPFSTVQLTCVDRVCTDSRTGSFDNTQGVADAISYQAWRRYDAWLTQGQVIATGDLPFELPGGAVGVAFGAETQRFQEHSDVTDIGNRCDRWIDKCDFDYKAEQSLYRVFGETVLPVFSGDDMFGNMEVQLAGSYTNYDGIGGDFSPKIAGLWQPLQWLSVRASYAEAFIVPTTFQRFGPSVSFLQATGDPIFNDPAGTFRSNRFGSNPDLESETAEIFNIGVGMKFFDDTLGFGVDYSTYDFEDRISRTSAPQVVDRDFRNFQARFPNPTPADRLQWACGGLADPAIIRPLCSVGITNIEIVETSWLNAQQMKHVAWDFYGTYQLDMNDYGALNFRVDATLVDEYSYDLGGGIRGDGVGRQNHDVPEIPPTPEWRVIGAVNYSLGDHRVVLRARHTKEFDLDAAGFANPAVCGAPGRGCTFESITYVDLSYAYRAEQLIGNGTTTFEVGGRNIFDEMPKPLFFLGGIETFVHSPIGAQWWVRLSQEL